MSGSEPGCTIHQEAQSACNEPLASGFEGARSRTSGRSVECYGSSTEVRRFHGRGTADLRGGATRRSDSFQVRDDTPGMCRARAKLKIAASSSARLTKPQLDQATGLIRSLGGSG